MDTSDLQSSAVDGGAADDAAEEADGDADEQDPGDAEVEGSASTEASADDEAGDTGAEVDPEGSGADEEATEATDGEGGDAAVASPTTTAGTTAPKVAGPAKTPLQTPVVGLSSGSAVVGEPLWASWPADAGTGRFDYRITVDGSTTLSSSVTGAAGATEGVVVIPDRSGELCVYVRAIFVAGVTDPGYGDSAESAPGCASIFGDSQSMAQGHGDQLPAP